ncbi:RDD family protein [Nocardia caishijiensis]|uniref:RDD family protein n=1 Tax=Nocardia caishijiensis TaxID=184756 RepID=A0ABQ6YLK2_9NOCA|nr:RDD family protein [Nocardia caishijiensis]KAF0846543.1 RDD family protein [Nocardia caishijiensis]
MSDSVDMRKEAKLLSARYERDSDGRLVFVPAVPAKADNPDAEWPLLAKDSNGSTTRMWFAFPLDMSLHLAIGAAAWFAVPGSISLLYGLLAWLTASFLHRTVIQRLTRATLGKAVFGLRMRYTDGSYPTLGRLIKEWFRGLETALEMLAFFG